MKPSLPLLAILSAPFLFVGARLLSPRASIAQNSAAKQKVAPLPPKLTPEQARDEIYRDALSYRPPREREQLLRQASFDWEALFKQNRDLVIRQGISREVPNSLQVRVFAEPPFNPSQLHAYPLRGRFDGSDNNQPLWQGDLRLWFRIDGGDARVLPDALQPQSSTRNATGNSFTASDVWNEWSLNTNSYFMAARHSAGEPWQSAVNVKADLRTQSQLTRAELFNWNGTAWICLHVRSWGGGAWRYMLTPILRIPHYLGRQSTTSDPLPLELGLLPLRVETIAPVYGKADGPPPWPRTNFDAVSPNQPLLRAIEFYDQNWQQWKPVPEPGKPGFPLQLSSVDEIKLRAIPNDPTRPWPVSPRVYPRWKALRDGAVVSQGSGAGHKFSSSGMHPADNALKQPGYVKDSTAHDWRIRPSKNKSDLMTIVVEAGNALSVQVQVLPSQIRSAAGRDESATEENWGAVESLMAMRGPMADSGSSLWAVQKIPLVMEPQKFQARLWFSSFDPENNVKVTFHSQFADGTPCGTWETAVLDGPPGQGAASATTVFHPPTRTGLGFIWVEMRNPRGEKVGDFEKTPFAVLPVGLSCSTTDWKPTDQTNEWSREVHVFAGAQVPYSWRIQASKTKKPTKMASFVSTLPYRLQPIAGVPVRLSLSPAPYSDANAMPFSRLSTTSGQTTSAPINASTNVVISGTGSVFNKDVPRMFATQTVRWKLGDSNQLDNARVVAQLDVPETISKGNQGEAR